MNLQKKLIQLSEYKCAFKYVNPYCVVTMNYPENWSIIPSEDKSIEVAEEDGVTFYVAPIETDIDKTFQLIEDTIHYNLDVEKKMNLLKYNINKLQEIFAEKDLEELETIEFVFHQKKASIRKEPQPKSTVKRKYTKRKPNVEKNKDVSEIVQEEKVSEVFDETYDNNTSVETVNIPIKNEIKYLEEVER